MGESRDEGVHLVWEAVASVGDDDDGVRDPAGRKHHVDDEQWPGQFQTWSQNEGK